MMANLDRDVSKVLLTEEEIRRIVARLGRQITADYQGKNLLLVGILKGSVPFLSDLMRQIDLPCSLDFMAVSSYGSAARSSGAVKLKKDLDIDLAGYDVLLVEDILDTGVTLSNLTQLLSIRHPASLKICAFLDKPERRRAEIEADYVGAQVPDEFVVGYGLDFNEIYRNLPYVGVLDRRVYEFK